MPEPSNQFPKFLLAFAANASIFIAGFLLFWLVLSLWVQWSD